MSGATSNCRVRTTVCAKRRIEEIEKLRYTFARPSISNKETVFGIVAVR